jgi:hydrogenase nickel incorporation protein HypA/HybF
MHELAIAQSIAEVVTARATECHAARVSEVRLRIGAASGIVGESLRFCFESLAALDPRLMGARLAIEEVPHRAWCACCAAAFDVVDFVAECPTCSEWSGQVLSGKELSIVAMEIEPEIEPR